MNDSFTLLVVSVDESPFWGVISTKGVAIRDALKGIAKCDPLTLVVYMAVSRIAMVP